MKNKLFLGLPLSFVALLTLVPAKAIAQVYYYGTDAGVVYGGSYSYGPSFGFGFGPRWGHQGRGHHGRR